MEPKIHLVENFSKVTMCGTDSSFSDVWGFKADCEECLLISIEKGKYTEQCEQWDF